MNSTSHNGVAPNQTGLANAATGASVTPASVHPARIAPKKSKLTLGLLVPKPSQTKLSAKPSHSKLSKENPHAEKKSAPPSAFVDEKQEKRRSRLGGSASKLGGLGSLVRHASKGLLKDVTNARQSSEGSFDTSRFVNVGVEDTAEVAGDQTVVDVVNAAPSEPHPYQAALDGQDPDIAEVMVVKRSKPRAPIDLEWAEPDEITVETTRVRDNGIESDVEGGARKAKSGWWKRKNEGTKEEARPKIQRRLSALLSPTPKLEDLTPQEKPKSEANDGKGSLVIRAIRSVRSFNQVSAEDQTVAQEPPAKPSPPERTLRRAPKMTLALRRPSDSTLAQDMGAVSSPEVDVSRLAPSSYRRRVGGRHAPQPVEDSEPLEAQQPSEATPTESFARPILRSRPNSAVYADNRLSVVSILTNEDSQGGQSSSDTKMDRRSSAGSSIRWDPEAMSRQAKKMRKEREERMRQRAQEERERIKNGLPPPERSEKKQRTLAARRRTPLTSVFDDLDISVVDPVEEQTTPPQTPPRQTAVDPIMAATEAVLRQSMRPSPLKQSPEKTPRPRFRLKEKVDRPRPVGIVAVEGDGSDASMFMLNAANNDLQELLKSADLSSTPDTTPSLPSVTPVPRNESITSARRASHPMDHQDLEETQRTPLVRRTSGSGVVSQQVAAWPPVHPSKSPTSPFPNDLPLPAPRQRKRTSSSTASVPPSAFNRKTSLLADERPEESLTLRTLRSENGNVARKAKFYGDLAKEASTEREFGLRIRKGNQSKDDASRSSRARLGSFPPLEASSGVDITTDIPEELQTILMQAEPVIVPPAQQVEEEPRTKTESSDESVQEFVYTGVDAEPQSTTKDYNIVNEFSSYDNVDKADVPASEASPAPQPEDVFAPTKSTEPAVVTESDASYCVVSKRTAPFVLHKPEVSVDSPNQTINDTFAFTSKPNPFNGAPKPISVNRPHHRRTRSVTTPTSPASTDLSTGSRDDSFSFAPIATKQPARRPLADVFASPTSETDADNSLHLDEINLPELVSHSADSSTSGGLTSVDSFFDRSHNRSSSSTSSVFAIFGMEQSETERKGAAGTGNLFGDKRPMSLISSYSDVGVVSDEDGVREQLELVEGTGSKTPVPSRSPVKPKSPPKTESSPAKPVDTSATDRTLDEEIQAAIPRPRPRGVAAGSGHHRRRTTLGLSHVRQMTIAEAIQEMEMYEPAVNAGSQTWSRGSSNTTEESNDTLATTNISSTPNASFATSVLARPPMRPMSVPRHVSCASWHASTSWEDERIVAIAGGDPEVENNMVLRRYYTFQREAQEALERSHSEWQDTAFSMDEVTTFQPPTQVDAVEHFLNESRRFYSELPVEWKARARRRAMTAPYPTAINAHLEDKPESRSGSGSNSPVDAVFKDLSMWDHRRVRKVSEKRTRKVSEEGRRSRKTSTTMATQDKERVRKVSEKKKRTNVSGNASNPSSMSGRARGFVPFMDANEEGAAPSVPKNSKSLTINTTNLKTGNSLGTDMGGTATIGRARAKVLAKVALKLQQLEQEQAQAEAKEQAQEGKEPESNSTGKENASKDKMLRPKHSVEGMLESPTGSLRIARPRPKRKGLTPTVSPPSTIRL